LLKNNSTGFYLQSVIAVVAVIAATVAATAPTVVFETK